MSPKSKVLPTQSAHAIREGGDDPVVDDPQRVAAGGKMRGGKKAPGRLGEKAQATKKRLEAQAKDAKEVLEKAAEEAKKRVAKAAKPAKERIEEQAEEAMEALEKAAKVAKKRVAKAAKPAKERIEAQAEEAKEALEKAAKVAKKRVSEAAQKAKPATERLQAQAKETKDLLEEKARKALERANASMQKIGKKRRPSRAKAAEVEEESAGDRSQRTAPLRDMAWSAVSAESRTLATRITKDFTPELVLGVVKGGAYVGEEVAELLACPFRAVRLHPRSRDAGGMEASDGIPADVKGKRVLVVDDIAGTGESLTQAAKKAKSAGAKAVRTAALVVREGSFQPDFFALETADLVVFPWDYEASPGAVGTAIDEED